MPEVGVAHITENFYPPHAKAIVHQVFDDIVRYRQGKRRPAGTAVELSTESNSPVPQHTQLYRPGS